MGAVVIPDIKTDTLKAVVTGAVEPGSTVSTDELVTYGLLGPDGSRHGQVKHVSAITLIMISDCGKLLG